MSSSGFGHRSHDFGGRLPSFRIQSEKRLLSFNEIVLSLVVTDLCVFKRLLTHYWHTESGTEPQTKKGRDPPRNELRIE